MRILVIGAGGVGSAFIPTALRRSFFEHIVVADYDAARAERVVARAGNGRFSAARVDASDARAIEALCREGRISHQKARLKARKPMITTRKVRIPECAARKSLVGPVVIDPP